MIKPRSPSERKIGVARRKSQEMLRQSSLREKQREIEKLRNRPGVLGVPSIDTKSPGPLKRGKPNTFQVLSLACMQRAELENDQLRKKSQAS